MCSLNTHLITNSVTAHVPVIYCNPHNSSNCDSHITRQLG